MTVLTEGNLEFSFNAVQSVDRLDDAQHGMTHCMKAVDFIVESNDRYWFIEVKDPDNPRATAAAKKAFAENLKTGKLRKDLVIKYRDSFLYRWAMKKLDKPVKYVVLLCMKALDDAALLQQNDNLRRNLPTEKANSWQRPLADSCVILDFDGWNKQFPNWQVTRTSVEGTP